MAFADIEAETTITGFSNADETTILDAMETAYEGSAIAEQMFDDWIAAGNDIEVDFSAGDFQALTNTGKIEIDLDYLDEANYIDNNGQAVEDTPVTAIVHELVHAITGRRDNTDYAGGEYRGDTVKFSNTIYAQLGLPEQNSYAGYDSSGDRLTRDFEYTGGAAIDRSMSLDRNWDSSGLGESKDLLVGGPSANTLSSGDGADFLFGGGGDDTLQGGDDADTAVFSGDPTDYDVRLQADGSWTARHVRGDADEGSDRIVNVEKIRFGDDGETFDLEKNGLDYQTDFAFVVDQTGSMSDDIAAVKDSATAIIDALFDGETDARIGVVGFRDNTIGQPTQVMLPFTDQDAFADREAAALTAIDSLFANGGGDFPESTFDGLLKALDGTMGDWREGAGTKRIALFTDATAKDAFLFPTVLSYALDVGAVITGAASRELGDVGMVDSFELTPAGAAAAGRDPLSEGDPLPDFDPAAEIPEAPGGGGATVQVFTIFIQGFATVDPDIAELTDASGGDVLSAATPAEVVERILEVIEEDEGDDFNEIVGTPGDDEIDGSDAADRIQGGAGDDEISGRAGDDLLEGGAGDDDLGGGAGNDRLEGGDGEDDLRGWLGDDALFGGAGEDDLRSGDGNDTLEGGDGEDELRSGDGDDELDGGAGDDELDGDDGDDVLIGGAGSDELEGGDGADRFVFGPGDGGPGLSDADELEDFEDGVDLIALRDGLSFNDLTLSADDGDAVIRAGGETLAVVLDASGDLDATDFTLF